MSINTKIRLAILASSVALAAAAPAAFGAGAYSPEGGKADVTAGSAPAAQEKLVPMGAVPDTGTASSYKPEGGPTDATGRLGTKKAKHIKHVKHKKAAPSDPDASPIQQQPGVPKN